VSFRTIPVTDEDPLRVILVGAGTMGRHWLATLTASPDVELVGIADLDLDAASAAAGAAGRADLPLAGDAIALAQHTGAQALINVTIPEAHHPITTAALFAGLPVLGEKPAAEDVSHALSLAAAAEVSEELFMVSQSRRWNLQLSTLRSMTAHLGPIGTVTTDFFRAPHFGGFRDRMAHPLLVDMAIHAFDSARFLLDSEPLSTYCQTYNPPWSWYAGDANAIAIFTMERDTRYVFNGSWCSRGAETSWNGTWRVSGEKGTALWNGDDDPVLDADIDIVAVDPAPHSGIAGALEVFLQALRTGQRPPGEIHENVMSLAMVEAAVQSAATDRAARLDDVLERAHAKALREEARADVRRALERWTSVREALTRTTGPAPSDGPDAPSR
jgi:predicted dehydrogenase